MASMIPTSDLNVSWWHYFVSWKLRINKPAHSWWEMLESKSLFLQTAVLKVSRTLLEFGIIWNKYQKSHSSNILIALLCPLPRDHEVRPQYNVTVCHTARPSVVLPYIQPSKTTDQRTRNRHSHRSAQNSRCLTALENEHLVWRLSLIGPIPGSPLTGPASCSQSVTDSFSKRVQGAAFQKLPVFVALMTERHPCAVQLSWTTVQASHRS